MRRGYIERNIVQAVGILSLLLQHLQERDSSTAILPVVVSDMVLCCTCFLWHCFVISDLKCSQSWWWISSCVWESAVNAMESPCFFRSLLIIKWWPDTLSLSVSGPGHHMLCDRWLSYPVTSGHSCCPVRVNAPHFYGSGILISLGRWWAGGRKVWKQGNDAVAESALSILGDCGCPKALSSDISPLLAVRTCMLSHIPVTFCPQWTEFPNQRSCQRFALVPKRRTQLFLGSAPGPIRFAFVLTWIEASVRERRLTAFAVLCCLWSTVSRASQARPGSVASLLPVRVGVAHE